MSVRVHACIHLEKKKNTIASFIKFKQNLFSS